MFNKKLPSEIIVTTQKEFDSIPLDYKGRIEIKDTKEYLCINKSFNDAYITVYGNATIEYVYDNATIESVSGNATIKYVSGNATIKYVYDNATILLLTGLASVVLLYSAKKIIAKGMNLIRQIGTEKIDMDLGKDVTFVQIKKTIKEDTTFTMFSKLYPVDTNGKKAILYKAVHKINDKYIADYDETTEYIIGETKEIECDTSIEESCSKGIHLSHLNWARLFGKNWEDLAILECETNIKDIIVSKDCDGKVRTSKVKILRELNKDEY